MQPIATIATETSFSTIDINNINSYWPLPNSLPRASQIKVLDWVQSLPSNIKYLLCEIPVGGGKSPLAMALSGWLSRSFGNAYILTPQKVLQKQYEDSFKKHLLHIQYGKNNYTCSAKKTNCDVGSEIKPKCDNCPHKQAWEQMARAPNVILNYTLGLLLFKYVTDDNAISRRKLMVFDEAHTLETHLTEFNAIVISEFRCKQIGTVAFKQFTNLINAVKWVRDTYMPALMNKISKLNPMVQDITEICANDHRPPTDSESNVIALLKELSNHRAMISEQLIAESNSSIDNEYVLVNEGKSAFKFKELYGKRNFRQFVEPLADRFLFMSSTILDKNAFCEDLGLDPEQAAFISLDSEFEPRNRPIFYMPTAKMTFGWHTAERQNESNRMVKKIQTICNELHADDSGIIHTGSFQIAEWLALQLENKIPHTILHHNPGANKTRDNVLDEFQEQDNTPKLLISPSITEGLDLKDEKGRFAIFAKVPFPFLGDAWVKKRMSLSDTWYKKQALIAIIQGAGRIVRSSTDWGHVYILDSSFGYLHKQSQSLIPAWWDNALVTLE